MSQNNTIANNQAEELTLQDVINAVNAASTANAEEFHEIRQDIGTLKKDVVHIKNVMVTKSYLDDKLSDQKADLIKLTRKEDTKLVALIEDLHSNKVISDESNQRILALEPFPQ